MTEAAENAAEPAEGFANKPTVIHATGGVKVKIWNNHGPHGDFQNVSIETSYKDGEEWKTQKISLGKDAVLSTARALEHAHDAIVAKDQDITPGRAR